MTLPWTGGSHFNRTRSSPIGLYYEETFTSTPATWQTDDSIDYTISGGNLNVNPVHKAGEQATSPYDQGSIDISNPLNLGAKLSDVSWTIDFDYDIQNIITGHSAKVNNCIKIQSENINSNSTNLSLGGDGILFLPRIYNIGTIWFRSWDFTNGSWNYLSSNYNASLSIRQMYLRFIRVSATQIRIILSPNKDWSNPIINVTSTMSSDVTDLKYIIFCSIVKFTSTNRLDINYPTVRVYDGQNRDTTNFDTVT